MYNGNTQKTSFWRMFIMKKKLVIVLCLVLSLSMILCSCGGNTDKSDDSKTKTTTVPSRSVQGEAHSTPTTTTNDASDTDDTTIDAETTTEAETPDTTEVPTDATEVPTETAKESTTTQKPTTSTTKKPTTTTKAPTTTQTTQHKHSYTAKVTKAATCTATGVKTYTCSGCSHQYTETIAKTAHTWGSWHYTKLANPVENGNEERICSTCKTVEKHTVNAFTPSGNYFWNPDNFQNGTGGKVNFLPRFLYWSNGNLYMDYFLVNLTGHSVDVKAIKSLTISYVDPTTQVKTVIAKVTNFKYESAITMADKTYQYDLYICIGTNDIVNANYKLDRLNCVCELDLG